MGGFRFRSELIKRDNHIWKKRDLSLRELLAMADYSDSRGVTDALALSFYYGQATCYRAVKGRFDGAGCEHRAYIR